MAAAAAVACKEDGSEEGDWQRLLKVLLELAAHMLVPGGRLLAWMPRQGADNNGGSCIGRSSNVGKQAAQGSDGSQQEGQLRAWCQQNQLYLLHFLPEMRQAGYPRAMAVSERSGGDGSGWQLSYGAAGSGQVALLEALRAAASNPPVHNLPTRLPQPWQVQLQHQDLREQRIRCRNRYRNSSWHLLPTSLWHNQRQERRRYSSRGCRTSRSGVRPLGPPSTCGGE